MADFNDNSQSSFSKKKTQQKNRLPEKKRYFMPFSFGCIKHAVSILKSLINHNTLRFFFLEINNTFS